MCFKVTRNNLINMAKQLKAEDITYYPHTKIQNIVNNEKQLNHIIYSCGMYGTNAILLQGFKSKKFYVITSRTTALYSI